MSVNSKRKGKRGELDLVHFLKERGIEARRGQQFQGGEDSPDVITSIGVLHLECKFTENLRLYPALDQAKTDALPHQIPVVAHRAKSREWVAILKLDDLLKLFISNEPIRIEKPFNLPLTGNNQGTGVINNSDNYNHSSVETA